MSSKSQNAIIYLMLLLAQSASTFLLFWLVFPIFYNVVTNLGKEQNVALSTQFAIVVVTVMLHLLYWSRIRWVYVAAPFHNIVVAHLLVFASRLNFLFGGVFFSTIFFRHLPELASLPPFGQALIKAILIGAVLFGLFCYSLELERLGKAIEEPPRDRLPN
ncbi:hypothetical protein [Ensifer aridi]|uniref:hypothetical protein n=1 Tax=Ensifer aridi TaxID=1708715 RepID=UPI000A11A29A|nr:hypothetical protein [Ensifer aridi]